MTESAARRRHQRSVVAVCLAMAVVGVNATAVGVATRGMATDLGLDVSTLSLVVGTYLLVAASFSLIGGRLGDVAGRTRTFVVGVGIFAVGALLAATAPSAGWLIAARAVEGLGAALVLPASIEIVVAHPPSGGARTGFRARSIVYASAFGIGPLVGGLLTDHVSWRAIFWLELVVLVTTAALAAPLVGRRSQLPHNPTRDLKGAALTAALVAVALGSVSQAPTWGWWSLPMLLGATATVLLAVLLVLVERRTEHPILHRRVVTNRTVIGANLATLGASIGMIGLVYFFNLFAQSAAAFDSTAVAVAVALVPFTVSIVLFASLSRRLARRFGFQGPILVGLVLSAAGFLWLSTTSAVTDRAGMAAPLALCGIGAGIANGGLTSPAVLALPRTRLDEAAGLFSLTRYVGSALAIALGTATYLAVSAQVPVPEPIAEAVQAEDLTIGSTFHDALATLDEDLRGPFEAATRDQTAEAFASTMRLAGFAVLGLTVLAAVLVRGTIEDLEPDPDTGRQRTDDHGGP